MKIEKGSKVKCTEISESWKDFNIDCDSICKVLELFEENEKFPKRCLIKHFDKENNPHLLEIFASKLVLA